MIKKPWYPSISEAIWFLIGTAMIHTIYAYGDVMHSTSGEQTTLECMFNQKVLVTRYNGVLVDKELWLTPQGVYDIPRPIKCKSDKK